MLWLRFRHKYRETLLFYRGLLYIYIIEEPYLHFYIIEEPHLYFFIPGESTRSGSHRYQANLGELIEVLLIPGESTRAGRSLIDTMPIYATRAQRGCQFIWSYDHMITARILYDHMITWSYDRKIIVWSHDHMIIWSYDGNWIIMVIWSSHHVIIWSHWMKLEQDETGTGNGTGWK